LNVTHARNDSLFQSSSVVKSTISVIKLTNTHEIKHFNTKILPSYNSFTIIANKDFAKQQQQRKDQSDEPQIKLDSTAYTAKYQKNQSSFLQVKSYHQLRRNSTGSFQRRNIAIRKESLSHNNLLLLEPNSLSQKNIISFDTTKIKANTTEMTNMPRRKTLLTTYEITRRKSVC
jgi:hypothetical protein